MGVMDKVKDAMTGGSHNSSSGQQSEYAKPGNDDYNNPALNQGMGGNTGTGTGTYDQRGSSFESSRGSDLGMGSPNDQFSTSGNTASQTGRFGDQGNTGMGGGGMSGYGNTRDDESGDVMGGMSGGTGQSGYGGTTGQYGDNMDTGNTGMGMGGDPNFNNMSGRGDMTGDDFNTSTGTRNTGGMGQSGYGQTQGYGQSQSDY
ncbi:uncharacterized protein L201_003938 [Kwoniella dendrophila CBS 6074]|uniref:Uncharacterized protein n=1 Tax=Kwoniella dendrophila CBS 6074 TaxID=1295534 RepID=A0AAX4JUC3_9TREE